MGHLDPFIPNAGWASIAWAAVINSKLADVMRVKQALSLREDTLKLLWENTKE
ncbi:hypothetical protein WDM22_22580 [Bradyrhizobium septentrionale]|uniref:hypothetical protein n=1 Tax=Bradyrhizobium septentrionale TaxID=1404411 RepID=UPI0030D44A75